MNLTYDKDHQPMTSELHTAANVDRPVQIWDANGKRYTVTGTYIEDGALCIDIDTTNPDELGL